MAGGRTRYIDKRLSEPGHCGPRRSRHCCANIALNYGIGGVDDVLDLPGSSGGVGKLGRYNAKKRTDVNYSRNARRFVLVADVTSPSWPRGLVLVWNLTLWQWRFKLKRLKCIQCK